MKTRMKLLINALTVIAAATLTVTGVAMTLYFVYMGVVHGDCACGGCQ